MTNISANATGEDENMDIVKATSAGQPSQTDQVKDNVQEMLSASATTAKSYLTQVLPLEMRLKIWEMVVEDMPDTIDLDHRRLLQSNLSQPNLARVNHQLRNEVLPIFYKEKRFVIRIQPEDYSAMNSLWRTVVDRFLALEAVVDGQSHLSRIQRLDIELWDRHLKRYPGFGFIPTSLSDRANYEFYYRVVGGIFLQFGPFTGPDSDRSEGRSVLRSDKDDFPDRDEVEDSLGVGFVSECLSHGHRHMPQTSFWADFPLERLVDLAMMAGTKCEVPARQVHLGTCFVDLGWVGNDPTFGPFFWQRR